MQKKRGATLEAAKIKRELQIANRELHHLTEAQWSYAKHMLKFGLAAWVFGISVFLCSIVLADAQLLGETQPVWTSLLVLALAAPVVVTAVLVRKFSVKIKRLERIRRGLLTEYEKAVLKRVGRIITSRG